jgi:hypothetical protein
MTHEKRHNLLNEGFRKLDNEPRDASDLLAFIALALFLGATAIWAQIAINCGWG